MKPIISLVWICDISLNTQYLHGQAVTEALHKEIPYEKVKLRGNDQWSSIGHLQ
jgi:hypothetical protein